VLKAALYARNELNIRSTTNYLLSIAANARACGPFLRKYFGATVKLPSDWLDVAATYQMLPDRTLTGSAIPTCLRKAMTVKFADFDSYQLAKYNKEGAIKRKKKKQRLAEKKNPEAAAVVKQGKPTVTLKQMIRQLHMSKPPYAVMCILGKKYPETETEFRAANLPGEFDAALAGRRMKLPVPETWETLVSQKGNKAATWEELIEHKKLPFMAMLRNLRNLIFTGVHPKYHRWVMNKLKNEKTIASSKQFPFRFFSAYEVIPKDLDDFKERLTKLNNPGSAPPAAAAAKPGGTATEVTKRRKRKHQLIPTHMPTPELFGQYREALDTAVKLATTHNVKPIRGSTVVFCDASQGMRDATTATGVGKFNQLNQIGALLGLMCKYVCEDCEFMVFGGRGQHARVELREGTILDNMAVVEEQGKKFDNGIAEAVFPFDYLEGLIARRERIDNLLVLSHHLVVPNMAQSDADPAETIGKILAKYRREVNPSMLFVSVDLSGRGCSIAQGCEEANNPNDILVSGFSDAILRFIAERGDTNQLQHVEHIDVAYKLPALPPGLAMQFNPLYAKREDEDEDDAEMADVAEDGTALPPPPPPMPVRVRAKKPWKTARVFISSTFLDMHGERDLLTRKVFPELRERCERCRIHLEEVDLRWGITEKESQDAKGVQVCLEEVAACQPFFIGFVGSRYGWCPPGEYPVPQDDERFAWVREYPTGRSITELEMYRGAVMNSNPHAFFYFRDADFAQQVPAEHRRAFAPESDTAAENLSRLRQMIRGVTRNVVTYPATWGGVVDGKPTAGGLTPLHRRILDDLWSTIRTVFAEETARADDDSDDDEGEEVVDVLGDEGFFHDSALEAHCRDFIGRKELLKQLREWADDAGMGVLALTGCAGSGKSALAAYFASTYGTKRKTGLPSQSSGAPLAVISHFVGASPLSQSLRGTLTRLCLELEPVAGGPVRTTPLPQDAKGLEREFARLLEAASFRARVVLVIDGVDQLSAADRAHSLAWLPRGAQAKVLLTMCEGAEAHRALKQRKPLPRELAVTQLELLERRMLVNRTLARHHKKLDERAMNDQMRMILKKPDSARPLYLKIVCEELRVFGIHEQLTERIRTLGPSLAKLVEEVLDRLEADHGRELVAQALAAIACSRGGLH
jgi:telomerase protein component 1